MYQIQHVDQSQIQALRTIGMETFAVSYQDDYDPTVLENYCQNAFSIATLEEELSDDNVYYYFLKKGPEICGYFRLNVGEAQSEPFDDDYAEIQRLYILPQFQGQKLGALMIQNAFDISKSLGKTKVWLGVWEENDGAIAFYKKQGLVETGDHEFVMEGIVDRDLIFEKHL